MARELLFTNAMRSLFVALVLFTGCQTNSFGTAEQSLAIADDDSGGGGGGGGGGNCSFSDTKPATLATYASVLQGMWTNLQSQYNAAHCPPPASWSGGCNETTEGGGHMTCTASVSGEAGLPACHGDPDCPNADYHCLPTGVCARVCSNPCETAGACGTLLSCDVAFQCNECQTGICGSEHTCVSECDAQRPCSAGTCDPQTQRCVQGCVTGQPCGDNNDKICNDQQQCVDRECTYDNDCHNDPEHYRCDNGECMFRCQDNSSCTVYQSCQDGVCKANTCDATHICPTGDFCSRGLCMHGCTTPGYECPSVLWCNPDTLQCDGCNCPAGQNCGPGGSCIDPCAGMVCPYPQTCSDGVCSGPVLPCGGLCDPFTQTCVNNQCVSNGACSGPLDCDIGQVCSDGVCVPDTGGGDGCVLDGVCSAGETCACDAYCCGGGGGCGWDGGSSITYEQCAQCGGQIQWGGDGMYCIDMSAY